MRQPLAEDDVEGPAQAGEGGVAAADRIQSLDPAPDRQQHGQTGDGQADQGEMHRLARMDQGQGQRAAELDGDGQTQGNGPQRHVEAEVHQAQDQAVEQHPPGVGAGQSEPPGPPDRDQDQGRQADAQGGGALGPDQREQALGKGGADRQRHHPADQGEVGQGSRKARRIQVKGRGGHRPGT
ncbi:hypothetical protein D3C81_1625490 [compost metagenome]